MTIYFMEEANIEVIQSVDHYLDIFLYIDIPQNVIYTIYLFSVLWKCLMLLKLNIDREFRIDHLILICDVDSYSIDFEYLAY